jgi:hypothetical protein
MYERERENMMDLKQLIFGGLSRVRRGKVNDRILLKYIAPAYEDLIWKCPEYCGITKEQCDRERVIID